MAQSSLERLPVGAPPRRARVNRGEWSPGRWGACLEGSISGALERYLDAPALGRECCGIGWFSGLMSSSRAKVVLFSKREASRMNFHGLLRVARMLLWQDQREAWLEIVGSKPPNSESEPGKKPTTGNTAS